MGARFPIILAALLLVAVAPSCKREEGRAPSPAVSAEAKPKPKAPAPVPAGPAAQDQDWMKRMNLPVDPGDEHPLGVPIPVGFRSRGYEGSALKYAGDVPLRTTLDFYRRILKTLFIEERHPGDWYFDKADLKVGRLSEPMLVNVRKGAGGQTEILVSAASQAAAGPLSPTPPAPPPSSSATGPTDQLTPGEIGWKKLEERYQFDKPQTQGPRHDKYDPIYY